MLHQDTSSRFGGHLLISPLLAIDKVHARLQVFIQNAVVQVLHIVPSDVVLFLQNTALMNQVVYHRFSDEPIFQDILSISEIKAAMEITQRGKEARTRTEGEGMESDGYINQRSHSEASAQFYKAMYSDILPLHP